MHNEIITVQRFSVVAFTHAGIGLNELGQFHLDPLEVAPKMEELKSAMDLEEIMYLSTCNRVEIIFVSHEEVNESFVGRLIQQFQPELTESHISDLAKKARFWNGINAVNHLIEVASSLDSMVLGEREIITQVRNAFEYARKHKLSGDTIRVVIRQTIETAKKVYTETSISEKSVSVVSLAYQAFAAKNIPLNARILVVGAGVTNQNLTRFLTNDGYTNFTVFNRTLEKGQILANTIGGEALPLTSLANFENGFDVLISCTGANKAVIDRNTYRSILTDKKKKTIIDLAIPEDIDSEITEKYKVDYISVSSIKEVADQNLAERRKELLKARQIIFDALEDFKQIFKMRQMERKMQSIPKKVKEIRSVAINSVFSREIDGLDEESKEVLDKILNYMEKKYVSIPMLMAKEMLSKNK